RSSIGSRSRSSCPDRCVPGRDPWPSVSVSCHFRADTSQLWLVAVDLIVLALEAFNGEHRRCGDLDGGVDDERLGYRVWMTCSGCGARLERHITSANKSSPLRPAA